jgi:hypothetical protein
MKRLKHYKFTGSFYRGMKVLVDQDCKICHGAGSLGRVVSTGLHSPCKCLIRTSLNIDWIKI